jgi:plastocyanin
VNTSVGSMVRWKNEDNTLHTVTSGAIENQKPTPDNKFNSGYLKSGDSFSFIFDSAGNYPYFCSIHPWMTGKVIVK